MYVITSTDVDVIVSRLYIIATFLRRYFSGGMGGDQRCKTFAKYFTKRSQRISNHMPMFSRFLNKSYCKTRKRGTRQV